MTLPYVPLDSPDIVGYIGIPATDPRALVAAKALRIIQQCRSDRLRLEQNTRIGLAMVADATLAGVPGDCIDTGHAGQCLSALIQGLVSEREAILLLTELGADPAKLAEL